MYHSRRKPEDLTTRRPHPEIKRTKQAASRVLKDEVGGWRHNKSRGDQRRSIKRSNRRIKDEVS
jgi:hypothetical protein